jgi:2-keto-4-pentenoate hydratase/2-oxohepta-3-ene-1,7-dioic acid hydratase in catechol pathway
MRLVSYDRQGARRLGAWVDGTLVDLPDAVGHPSFPSTMEDLVAHGGGTILDAAVHALSRPDYVADAVVGRAHLLLPFVPEQARLGTAFPGRLLGPSEVVAWTPGLRCRSEPVCIVGRTGRTLSVRGAVGTIFGVTLMTTFVVPGDAAASTTAYAFGPCVATPSSLNEDLVLILTVGDEPRTELAIPDVVAMFASRIAEVSEREDVRPGDLFGLEPGAAEDVDLSPREVVRAGAESIGTLVTRIGGRRGH